MTVTEGVVDTTVSSVDDRAAARSFRRLVWFLLLIYGVALLDRLNIAFAGLSMNKDLGLSATAFGFASTVVTIAYFFCEIPSNLLMAKYGARIWIPRIMVTWGVAAALTMLTTGAYSLYIYRAVLGVAEAGLVPGLVLYLTYWFPRHYRARATSLLLIAPPLTIGIGSAISGLILGLDGILGLAGWRWLFLLEGLPAVILGAVAYFYLPNGPATATWLSDDEKSALQARLESERVHEEANTVTARSVVNQLRSLNVALLALAYFGLSAGLNANAIWTPQIVREFAGAMSFSQIGYISAIPALVTVLIVPLWGMHSDRTRERKWHIVLPLLLSAAGWMLVALSNVPQVRLFGLVCASTGIYSATGMFWTLPTSAAVMSPRARPAGLALINSIGILGAGVSPFVIGYLKDLTGSFASGLIFTAAALVATAICTSVVAKRAAAGL
jgi:ACS family 4-hydroxyphenylacetate permease-like MFS transporter